MQSITPYPAKTPCFSILLWTSLLLGFVLHTSIGHAASLYVARTTSASDNNDGSVSRPLRSIARAVERAKPGDVVIVQAGDYRQDDTGWGRGVVPILVSGQSGKTIRIVGANGARPLVHSFLIRGAKFVRVSGFEFRYFDFAKHPKWQDMPTIVRDIPENPNSPIDYSQDWSQRRLLIQPAFSTYFSLIQKLEYVSGINLEGCNNVTVSENIIDGFWAGIQCRGCSMVGIHKNSISHTVNGIFTFEPSPALTNSVIQENTISHTLDIGISIQKGCSRVNVAMNNIRYTGRNHISVQDGNRNCTVVDNKVSYGGYYSETMRFPGSSGISIHSSLGGIEVIGNDVSYQIDRTGVDGNGIILDLMLLGSTVSVKNNMSFRNMGSGLNVTMSPNALIFQNAFLENGYRTNATRNGAGVKLSRSEDRGNVIMNNLFIANKHAGILSEETLFLQSMVDYNVYYSIRNTPIVWDSFFRGNGTYRTIEDLNLDMGWEEHGVKLTEKPDHLP